MDEIISTNPANLEEIGRVPITSPAKVREHVAKARAAWPMWRRLTFNDRGRYLLKAREYLLDNIDHFAQTITKDNGKPLVESLTAEIYPIADLLYHFANHAEDTLKEFNLPIGIMNWLGRRSRISFQPLGVIGIISPWNYPFSIAAGEVASALVCGNAVLLKPSSATPLVGNLIEEMYAAAELPPDIFTHVPGNASTGTALIESHIDKLLFTGSVSTGKEIMAACAKHLTPLVLELGGKDPMIVRADADLDQATSGAVWGAFTNCGQCCASVERVYVHESIFDQFVQMCVDKAAKLKIGNGLDPDVEIGAMTTLAQLKQVETHVEEATARGATVHCGGRRLPEKTGYFFPPTIITGVDHSFSCVRDESFGPLMPVMRIFDDRQAIQLANDSAYGLTASIWTKNIRTADQMAREIRTGTVMINDCVFTHALPQTPWGGCKHSGFGRSHSRFGLQELVTIHHIHTNPLRHKDMWWYGYNLDLYQRFSKLASLLTSDLKSKLRGFSTFLKIWRRPQI